jgi:hypothetical protein
MSGSDTPPPLRKRWNTPHSIRFATSESVSKLAKPLECAEFLRFSFDRRFRSDPDRNAGLR